MTARHMTALLCLLGLGCKTEEVHSAKVVLSEVKQLGKSSLAGFACTTSDGRQTGPLSKALLARAFRANADRSALVMRATVVIDYVALGGYPRCRATEITNYCEEEGHSCAPVASERVCIDLDPMDIPFKTTSERLATTNKGAAIFADYVKTELADRVVTQDAPSTESILRLVGTTETCAEIEARAGLDFDPERLLGCTYSCPIVPDAARGEILLDFEGLGACEDDVIYCASASFTPRAQRDIPGITSQ